MAFHNVNYQIVPLISGGTYSLAQLGDGLTASTVHEIYCLSAGTISITALGGGTVTLPMTVGQSIKVLAGHISVASGSYAGFRSKFQFGGIGSTQWGGNL